MYTAYLIIICDKETNAIKGADIWSSPEWEQSRRLEDRTYILYQVRDYRSYQQARDILLECLKSPYFHRYSWALDYLNYLDEYK